MTAEIIKLPGSVTHGDRERRNHQTGVARSCSPTVRRGEVRNMHTLLFRSYDLIAESDDADLARDVAHDVDKAERKLKKVRQRLQDVQEQAAARVQLLTTVEAKLAGAIVVALLTARQR